MEEETEKTPRQGRLRTITLPPPVQGWADEMASLEEAGAELAVELWRMLRKLRNWVETPPEDRAGLFEINKKDARQRLGFACIQAPDLVEAFGTFALLIRAPGLIGTEQLAEACRQVHCWAEERALLDVAMLFAEAAAIVEPDSPARANDAGRVCRRAARDERASVWYHRAFGLGVRAKSHKETIRAQLGYGTLMRETGRHDEARKFFERAAQRALNTGRMRQAGEAHHDLLLMCAEVGELGQAERHARRALDLYPIHHPRVPYLIHDFAFLLTRKHYYTPALALLERLVTVLKRPDEALLAWGSLARAAAGSRRRARFNEAEQKILPLAGLHEEHSGVAFIHLAEGHRAFGQWDKAEHYATLVVETARKRKDALIERDGLDLLKRIASRDLGPCEEDPTDRDRLATLQHRFMARLDRWKAPGRDLPRAHPEPPPKNP